MTLKTLSSCALLLGLALAAGPAAAAAVHKCTGADGKISFQDAPCRGGKDETLELRPASGPVPSSTAPAATGGGAGAGTSSGAGGQSEAQRIEGEVAKSQAERRKRELETVLIPNARRGIDNQLASCDAEQQRLQAKKATGRPQDPSGRPFEASPRNAIAHAQWENSVSEEMSAAARNCATRTRMLTSELESLRRECSAVGCVPQ